MTADAAFVFDACALIAFLEDESGADIVETLLQNTEHRRLIHTLNVCEIYYDLVRRGHVGDAEVLDELLIDLGLVLVDELPSSLWQTAGDLKAHWRRVSLADCLAVALAIRECATLVTSDHGELDSLSEAEVCPICFIR